MKQFYKLLLSFIKLFKIVNKVILFIFGPIDIMNQQNLCTFTYGNLIVVYKSILLTLKRNFTTAHSTSATRTNFIVKISDQTSIYSGYGECGLPPKKPGCYLSDINDCFQFMSFLKKQLTNEQKNKEKEIEWDKLLPEGKFQKIKEQTENKEKFHDLWIVLRVLQQIQQEHYRAPKCALQFALFDWLAKNLEIKLVELIFGKEKPKQTQSFSFYTISYEQNIEEMLENAEEGLQTTHFLKFKFNNNVQKLVSLLEKVSLMGKCEQIIVDANTSWKPEDFQKFISLLAESHVKRDKIMYIEQPFDLQIGCLVEWQKIKQKSPIKILADESCRNEKDFQKLKKVAHAVNIKTEKTGGLCNSINAIEIAQEFGFEVILGTMVTTNLGCTQTFQMHPLITYFDIDGSLLVKDPSPTGGFLWGKGGCVEPFETGKGLQIDCTHIFK